MIEVNEQLRELIKTGTSIKRKLRMLMVLYIFLSMLGIIGLFLQAAIPGNVFLKALLGMCYGVCFGTALAHWISEIRYGRNFILKIDEDIADCELQSQDLNKLVREVQKIRHLVN